MNLRSDVRFFAVGFFILAVLLRITPHAYNLAAVGALGMFVGCFWSARMGIADVVAAMAVSDGLGNWLGVASMGSYETWLMLAVYAAIALCSGSRQANEFCPRQGSDVPMLAAVPLGAIASAAIFFPRHQLRVLARSSHGIHTQCSGLAECYAAAMPFAKNTADWKSSLLGTLLWSYGVLTGPAAARSSAK